MRLFLIIFLSLSNIVKSQPFSKYTAIYTKTIETTLALSPDKVRMNVGDNLLAKEIAEQALNDLTGTPLQLHFMDSLHITSDSVVAYQIPCAAPNLGTSVRLNVKPTQMVIKPNSYYQVSGGGAETIKQRAIPTLVKVDKKDFVLNYACEVYQSEDGKLKLWVCSDLPPSINAGLPLLIPMGAVLKYQFYDKVQKVTATLVKLTGNKDGE